jgi:hypothetical protein
LLLSHNLTFSAWLRLVCECLMAAAGAEEGPGAAPKQSKGAGIKVNDEDDAGDRISCECDVAVDYLDQRRKQMRPKKGARVFLARDDWGGVCLRVRPQTGGPKSTLVFKCEENIRRVFRDFEVSKGRTSIEFLIPRTSVFLSEPTDKADMKELMDTVERLFDDPLCADSAFCVFVVCFSFRGDCPSCLSLLTLLCTHTGPTALELWKGEHDSAESGDDDIV